MCRRQYLYCRRQLAHILFRAPLQGPCRRSFHQPCLERFDSGVRATVRASPGLAASRAFAGLFDYDRDDWRCSGCVAGVRDCFICGDAGHEGVTLFRCARLCGKFFHTACLATQYPTRVQWLPGAAAAAAASGTVEIPRDLTVMRGGGVDSQPSQYLEEVIGASLVALAVTTPAGVVSIGDGRAGASTPGPSPRFVCPFHTCAGCEQRFDAFHPPIFLRCHACPTAYHWACVRRAPDCRYDMADVITCGNKRGHDAKRVSATYRHASGLQLDARLTPMPTMGDASAILGRSLKSAQGRARIGDGLERKLRSAAGAGTPGTADGGAANGARVSSRGAAAGPRATSAAATASGASRVDLPGRSDDVVVVESEVSEADDLGEDDDIDEVPRPRKKQPSSNRAGAGAGASGSSPYIPSKARVRLADITGVFARYGLYAHFELLDANYYGEIRRRTNAVVAAGLVQRGASLRPDGGKWRGVIYPHAPSSAPASLTRYMARINYRDPVGGDMIVHLGTFIDPVEAAVASDYAVGYMRGMEARILNLPGSAADPRTPGDPPIDPWPLAVQLAIDERRTMLPPFRPVVGDELRYSRQLMTAAEAMHQAAVTTTTAAAATNNNAYSTMPRRGEKVTGSRQGGGTQRSGGSGAAVGGGTSGSSVGTSGASGAPSAAAGSQGTSSSGGDGASTAAAGAAGAPPAGGTTPEGSSGSAGVAVRDGDDDDNDEAVDDNDSSVQSSDVASDGDDDDDDDEDMKRMPSFGSRRGRKRQAAPRPALPRPRAQWKASSAVPSARVTTTAAATVDVLPGAMETSDSRSRSDPNWPKSTYVGVAPANAEGTSWFALVREYPKVKMSGPFPTEVEAALEFDRGAIAAAIQRGPEAFALTNFAVNNVTHEPIVGPRIRCAFKVSGGGGHAAVLAIPSGSTAEAVIERHKKNIAEGIKSKGQPKVAVDRGRSSALPAAAAAAGSSPAALAGPGTAAGAAQSGTAIAATGSKVMPAPLAVAPPMQLPLEAMCEAASKRWLTLALNVRSTSNLAALASMNMVIDMSEPTGIFPSQSVRDYVSCYDGVSRMRYLVSVSKPNTQSAALWVLVAPHPSGEPHRAYRITALEPGELWFYVDFIAEWHRYVRNYMAQAGGITPATPGQQQMPLQQLPPPPPPPPPPQQQQQVHYFAQPPQNMPIQAQAPPQVITSFGGDPAVAGTGLLAAAATSTVGPMATSAFGYSGVNPLESRVVRSLPQPPVNFGQQAPILTMSSQGATQANEQAFFSRAQAAMDATGGGSVTVAPTGSAWQVHPPHVYSALTSPVGGALRVGTAMPMLQQLQQQQQLHLQQRDSFYYSAQKPAASMTILSHMTPQVSSNTTTTAPPSAAVIAFPTQLPSAGTDAQAAFGSYVGGSGAETIVPGVDTLPEESQAEL